MRTWEEHLGWRKQPLQQLRVECLVGSKNSKVCLGGGARRGGGVHVRGVLVRFLALVLSETGVTVGFWAEG